MNDSISSMENALTVYFTYELSQKNLFATDYADHHRGVFSVGYGNLIFGDSSFVTLLLVGHFFKKKFITCG